MRQTGKVEHELRYRRRVTVPPQGLLEAIRLRRHVVDDNDRRRFAVALRRPPAIVLIGSTFIDRWLDHSTGAGERFEFAVDPDAILEGVVGTPCKER